MAAASAIKGVEPADIAINGEAVKLAGKTLLCAVWFVPAILVNVDSAQGQGTAWTACAVGSVIGGGACVIVAANRKIGWTWRLICALLAAVLLIQNTTTAIGNSAGYNDRQRDRSAAQFHKQERLEKRRAELWEARKAELAIAGNASVEEYEAEIEGAKASNAKLWERTGGCLPEYIRGYEDRQAFCRSIAEFEKKIAAAKARDEKDAQLEALEARDIDAERPAIESYVGNMSRFLALFGITPDTEVIASSRDWLRGIVIELLAMFGPEVTLLLIGMLTLRPEPALVARQKPDAPEKVKAAPTDAGMVGDSQTFAEALASDDPHIDAFIARRLVFVAGSSVLAGDLFKAWVADCAEYGLEPGSQKRFSARIQRRVARDKNNGRPKYLGVHLKARSVPNLRIVAAK